MSTADNGYGWISVVSGGSMINQTITPINCTAVIPIKTGVT